MKKPLSIALLLLLTLTIRAANIVTFGSAEGTPGDTVEVSLTLDNSDAISTLQVTLPLDATTHYVGGSAALTARRDDHSVSANESNGQLNIIVFSQTMTALKRNSGTLLTFKLCLGRKPETLALKVSKIIATNSKGDVVTCDAGDGGSVTTRCALATYGDRLIDFGRRPICGTYSMPLVITNEGNNPLTVTAFEFTSKDYSVNESLPLTVEAGSNRVVQLQYSPLERGTVTDSLLVVCNSVSKLNMITLKAEPYAVNELHVVAADGVADSIVTIHVTMNNMDAVTGLQMAFTLPNELQYVDGSFALSERKNGHSLLANANGSTLTAIAYSTAGNAFEGNDGDIASFKVKLIGPYSTRLDFSKALLTAQYKGETMNVLSDKYGADVSIRSPRISTESSIDMGRTPVTEVASQPLNVYNYGDAPLRIDRATFSSEGFAIDSLPIVIPSGEERTLKVVSTDSIQKTIDVTMRLYTNAPDNRMVAVSLTGSRFITNALTLSASPAFIGQKAHLQVSLDNTFDIKGLQFDVVYPKNKLLLTGDSAIRKTERMGDMTLSYRLVGDTVKIRAFSLTDTAIKAGNGNILSLSFDVPTSNAEGSVACKITNIKLSRTSDEEVHSDIVDPSATISWYLLGDVNYDKVVDASDASAIEEYAIGKESEVFRTLVADVNQDKVIDIADASALMSSIIGKDSNKSVQSDIFNFSADTVYIDESGKGDLKVNLNNESEFCHAFQMDISLPVDFNISLTPDNAFDVKYADRLSTFNNLTNYQTAKNVYSLASVHNERAGISAGEGTLFSVAIIASESVDDGIYDAKIQNVHLASMDDKSIVSDDIAFVIVVNRTPTGINNVLAKTIKQKVYTISGIDVSDMDVKNLPRGVYILNGRKFVVR